MCNVSERNMIKPFLTLSILLLVSCGQQGENATPSVEPQSNSHRVLPEKDNLTTVVDLSKVTTVHKVTEKEHRWVKSLKKGLKFEGREYFAQLTDCPVIHEGQVIDDSVYYFKSLNIYLVSFENQNVCIVPSENRVGIFWAGSRYSIPSGQSICFLDDQYFKPGIHEKIKGGKAGKYHLPEPVMKDLVAKWRYE